MNASRQLKVNAIKLSNDEISDISSQWMLTNKHISATNDMLKRQFPDTRGLQPTFLGQNLTFQVVEPPFVQILHAGKNHRMTVIGIDQSLVKVYDSQYRCAAPYYYCFNNEVSFRSHNLLCREHTDAARKH